MVAREIFPEGTFFRGVSAVLAEGTVFSGYLVCIGMVSNKLVVDGEHGSKQLQQITWGEVGIL